MIRCLLRRKGCLDLALRKQEDMEAMFAYLDKQLHGTEQGVLAKAEAHAAIENFFQVGLPGGKTLDRFDELVQVQPCGLPTRCCMSFTTI